MTPIYIPARWAASRAPGKLLRSWRGRPVLATTVEAAQAAELGGVTVLAADDRIAEAARIGGWPWIDASVEARNGSERIAACIEAGLLPRTPTAINLQGDAVGATAGVIRAALGALEADPDATLATVVVAAEEAGGRTVAKVRGGRAVDFARAPFEGEPVYRHVGVYAYRVERLLERAKAAVGPREAALSLEQLRWIEADLPVAVALWPGNPAVADAVDVDGDFAL